MTRRLARDPARRCLTLAEWPPVDRERWLAALQPGDLLEPGGSRAHFRPATNHKVSIGYGRWLAGLQHRGALDAAAEPGSRITPAAVGAWLAEMQQVNSTLTQISRLEELYQAARVMGPSTDWGWLRRLAGRVRARHQPARDKRVRLVGAEDLFALGCDLIAKASGTPRQRAVQFRDGLAIALLAARPLRRRNLAGLTLGTSLVQRGGVWWIVLEAAETKTHAPLEMPWPEALIPMLETWLAVHRPAPVRPAGALAPGGGRSPLALGRWLADDRHGAL
ncbi:hypothetical protein [Dankookia sp. P2]|uniref:hypothetical protein n=1 Tax=Dankookia sp. P2 TaxID=3423955 RepID=UPI003D66745D